MKRLKLQIFFLGLLSIFFTAVTAVAAISLPKIFTSNMVLQRDKPLKIWGWAGKGESVTVSFNGQKVKVKADKNGDWMISLKPMTMSATPMDMIIEGKNAVTLKNILIGDVYICSGQSNMEWVLKNTKDADKAIAASTNPLIRHFTAKKATSFTPQVDLAGGEWQECNPKTSPEFSAVAYYFANKLVKDLNVPIGLINSSWGGTNVQTWISWDVIGKRDEYKTTDINKFIESARDGDLRRKQYETALVSDKGLSEKWFLPETSTTDWKTMKIPNYFTASSIGNAEGLVWFRKDFEVRAAATKDAFIGIGPVDDIDSTFLNGQLLGSINGWDVNRKYKVPAGLLKAGKNVLVVKVNNVAGGGGIYGKPEDVYVDIDGVKTSLVGDWLYKTSVVTTDFKIANLGPNGFPSQLYNAMIAPIINYALAGGIWYQGEANADESYKYRDLFPDMIKNWRNKWNDDFPFYWVQLANFMKADSTPVQSGWAELREAQNMTLALPKTGQAVIIDIGEAGDIHPRNKADVGYRLALAAEKVTYNKDIVYSGPVYQSMKTEGDKIVLTFSNTGTGLWAKDKYDYVRGFAIAGSDQKFVWAKAAIDGNNVIVSSSEVKNPVAVRYAWGNNPDDANLYNREGLPTSPFRTDTWPGITVGKSSYH